MLYFDMASVEVVCVSSERNKETIIDASHAVCPRDSLNLDFLDSVRVVVFGSTIDNGGNVFLSGGKSGVSVIRCGIAEDHKPKEESLEPEGLIPFSEKQKVTISEKTGEVTKGIIIFMNENGENGGDGCKEIKPDDFYPGKNTRNLPKAPVAA